LAKNTSKPRNAISRLALAVCGLVLAVAPSAHAANTERLLGGAKGSVTTDSGRPLEGMMVQLISQKSNMRTTVYTNVDGHYEFPKLDPGMYTLRIAQPREFQPFVKKDVAVNGSPALDDIKLTRAFKTELLPFRNDIAAQMTGTEWLMSLSGTYEEKRQLTFSCNFCHSYQQILRNRYDEHGWQQIVRRMTHGAGSPLILMRPQGPFADANEQKLVKWLASVRGPDASDPSFMTLPRPKGRQTRMIITEYELPRLELATHDVHGNGDGKIWYSTHRSSFVGLLDPKTGAVKEYHVPLPDKAALPGTHWIHVDKKGIVWGSENWAHNIWRFDPKTEQFTKVHWNVREPINAPMGGNYALGDDGTIWRTRFSKTQGIDSLTGMEVKSFPTKKFPSTYGSAISADNRYFGGGAWPRDGEFDPQNNYWAGMRGGRLVKFDIQKKQVFEYKSPTPFTAFYTAHPDKNGEVWAGESHSGRYARLNPKTEEWVEYVLPEPYGFDRESWVDNSTTPVTVWYADHDGWITRLQPLD
jgi:streptogramin lyase